MDTLNTSVRWDLSNILCGPDLKRFENYLSSIKEKLTKIEEYSKTNILNNGELTLISKIIKKIESAESLYYCLTTEDIDPSHLTALNRFISALKSQISSILLNLQENLSIMSEKQLRDWSSSINQKNLITDLLKGIEKSTREEKMISNFTRETLAGLEDLYIQVRNNIKIDLEDGGNQISFAEAIHLALAHPEHPKRIQIFNGLNNTLETQANIFASIYNQMAGLRLHEDKLKKADYLDESLKLNGISRPTLDAMWNAVESNIQGLSSYFKMKAERGTGKPSWHEWMTSSQNEPIQLTFLQAVEEITKSLENIDSNMCDFARRIITQGWVDTEQRGTKSPGGFCAPFIPEGESRISLSFDNSMDSARRLAHELGHAWHFKQMKDIPSLQFSDDTFEMTIAETSSIFFETVFIDYIIQNAKKDSVRKAILGSKIEHSLNYLMSIRGAFLFENKFYEIRKKGQLNVQQIEELSLACQKKAYGDSLSEYESFVWIKYGQFYQANVPFYNYPYSFGFLLSIGLLELAKKDKQFNLKFQRFLSETGVLPLEQLFKKHFNINLSQPGFWQQSVQRLIQDIELYSHI